MKKFVKKIDDNYETFLEAVIVVTIGVLLATPAILIIGGIISLFF